MRRGTISHRPRTVNPDRFHVHRLSSRVSDQPRLVLDAVLAAVRPLVRLLVRHGVTYPAFAAALKRVFLDAARAELAAKDMPQTDSAVTLLSGVHRRDVRQLARLTPAAKPPASAEPLSLAAQVVARWMAARPRRGAASRAHAALLTRADFDALVAGVSSDVRPRAMLDELVRLGVAREGESGIELLADGFAPRQGFAETASLLAANLADHAATAAQNLQGDANFLEQAVFVDQISAASAAQLQAVAVQAWREAFRSVMGEAQARFNADASLPEPERSHRARFGVYFHAAEAAEQLPAATRRRSRSIGG